MEEEKSLVFENQGSGTVYLEKHEREEGWCPVLQRKPADQLVKKDGANVALKIAEADIKMEGQESSAKNANMNLAKAHINQKAYNTLQSAIDPAKLKMALPKEFQKLNMAVVSTRFRSYGGHAIAEINLSAENPPYTQ